MTEIIIVGLSVLACLCFFVLGWKLGCLTAWQAKKQAYRWYMANEKTLAELAECRSNSNVRFGGRDARGRFVKKESVDD